MPIKLVCDWCNKEEPAKLKMPDKLIPPTRLWGIVPIERESASEVMVSCTASCKKQLQDAHEAIQIARRDREKLEEKKRRKRQQEHLEDE